MGRPRAFDETAVLDAAAGEFRLHGFDGTSTTQLCGAAGVRRSSLYNTFESKQELFIRALGHYIDVVRDRQIATLDNDDLSGIERLQALIDIVIGEEEDAAHRGRAAGCMVVQSLLRPDLRMRDQRVQSMLDHDLRRRTDLLAAAIRAGQIDGSLSDTIDPQDGAMLVNTIISGLRVTAQTGIDLGTLRRIALAGLHVLMR